MCKSNDNYIEALKVRESLQYLMKNKLVNGLTIALLENSNIYCILIFVIPDTHLEDLGINKSINGISIYISEKSIDNLLSTKVDEVFYIEGNSSLSLDKSTIMPEQ